MEAYRPQVSSGCTPAFAIVNGHVHGPGALLPIPIHVFSVAHPMLFAGLHECLMQGIIAFSLADPQRTATTPIRIVRFGQFVILSFFEIWQTISEEQ